MNSRVFGRNSLLCVLLAIYSHAIGVPNLHVDELISASDLIAIADVTDVKMDGPSPAIVFRNQALESQAFYSTLLVKRTIKGSAVGSLTVKYSLPKSFIGYRSLQSGTRMIFLRREGKNYTVATLTIPIFQPSHRPTVEPSLLEGILLVL